MDPNNLLRGPRRAARRGEEALRYDRPGSEAPAAATPATIATPAVSTPLATTPVTTTRNQPPQPEHEEEEIWDGQWEPRREDPHWGINTVNDEYHTDDDYLDDFVPELRAERAQQAETEREMERQWREDHQRMSPGQRRIWDEIAEQDMGDEAVADREQFRELFPEDYSDYEGEEGEGVEEEEESDNGHDQANEHVETHGADDDTDSYPNSEDLRYEEYLREEEQYGAQLGRDVSGGDEDTEGDVDVDDEMHGPDDDIDADVVDVEVDDDDDGAVISFDPMLLGLKEINNLAHFSVSSHKPGNGVEELLHDDLNKYWQSDGPQPHLLTIHFLRRVEIRAIRFYVDYNQDESYTPTNVVLSAGTGHHDLLEFASLALTTPVGWQEIDLSGVGGGADGQSLCCWIVQIKVKENHQNGKDTHIRGIKLYAIDENAPPADGALDELARIKTRTLQMQHKFSKETMTDKDDYLFERLITQSPDKLPGAPERSGSMATFLRDQEIR
ncbi:hypothetical protein SEUCBS139899_008495 [Sporothrix eucalyptigena]|uniref:DOC domain-containing protein n=1 Tax=Sporothrix eucalyptigena TaxID=1812306 RepID=A0ABP0C9N6_9PEZI